jgi:hypothetical protein
MSFHDPFNVFVYRSNRCDVVPSKNSRNKLNYSVVIPNPVPIHALLYSLKNILGSSPLLPLKIGITMVIFLII